MTTFYRLLTVACVLYILISIGHDREPVFRKPSVECPK